MALARRVIRGVLVANQMLTDHMFRGENDRRANQRLAMVMPIRIRRSGEEWVQGSLLDISSQGALVAFEDVLDEQEQITIGFDLDPIKERSAQVVWHGDGIFGCTFTVEFDPEALLLIRTKGYSLSSAARSQVDAGEESIFDLIAEAKRISGVSATRLAHMLHVSRPTLWAWETGRSHPNEENLTRLKGFLGLSDPRDRPVQPNIEANFERLDALLVQERTQIADKLGVSSARVRIIVEF